MQIDTLLSTWKHMNANFVLGLSVNSVNTCQMQPAYSRLCPPPDARGNISMSVHVYPRGMNMDARWQLSQSLMAQRPPKDSW